MWPAIKLRKVPNIKKHPRFNRGLRPPPSIQDMGRGNRLCFFFLPSTGQLGVDVYHAVLHLRKPTLHMVVDPLGHGMGLHKRGARDRKSVV